jgi:hypothetical protein
MSATRATGATTQNALYGGRWGVFFIRWIFYCAYGIVTFAGKPGSRWICPALAATGAYVWRLPLDAAIQTYVLDVNWRRMPEPVTMEAAGAACLALIICVGVVVVPRLPQEGTAASALVRFLLRLVLLLAVTGGGAWYAGYRLPPEFMACLPDWQPTLADAVLISVLIAATFVYAVASKLLTLLLGAFPVVTRPLRPLRPLKAPSSVRKPARLRVVVPSLPTPG